MKSSGASGHPANGKTEPRPNRGLTPKFLPWLQAAEDAQLHLSAVTLGEIQAGVGLTREQGASKATEIEAGLDLMAQSHHALPMNSATFRVWARLIHRRPDTLHEDGMTAATAKVHALTVVTRNVADFANCELQMLNPFKRRQA